MSGTTALPAIQADPDAARRWFKLQAEYHHREGRPWIALHYETAIASSKERASLIERLREVEEARVDFVAAREAMNAVIPAVSASPAERALYDERYKTDHEAERHLFRVSVAFAQYAVEHRASAILSTPVLGERPERHAIVKWLRDREADIRPFGCVQGDPPASVIDFIADAIERGDHL